MKVQHKHRMMMSVAVAALAASCGAQVVASHAPAANTRLAFADASALSRGANAGVISSALAAAPIASTATASITSGLSGMRKPYWLR